MLFAILGLLDLLLRCFLDLSFCLGEFMPLEISLHTSTISCSNSSNSSLDESWVFWLVTGAQGRLPLVKFNHHEVNIREENIGNYSSLSFPENWKLHYPNVFWWKLELETDGELSHFIS
ncbi:hypothetical protein BJ742DRAFT_739278 [Cladochytrium replicatum]|nr:hypothetical protein BJ742DRAFT_739278 [Cladochytrium replicatum]